MSKRTKYFFIFFFLFSIVVSVLPTFLSILLSLVHLVALSLYIGLILPQCYIFCKGRPFLTLGNIETIFFLSSLFLNACIFLGFSIIFINNMVTFQNESFFIGICYFISGGSCIVFYESVTKILQHYYKFNLQEEF